MSAEATMNEANPAQPRSGAGGDSPATPKSAESSEPKGRSGRKPALILGLVLAVAGGAFVYHRQATANQEETDDAQIEADVVPIAARVSGQVLHVRVHENQQVHAGDVLFEIDPQEYQSRVAQAEAELEMQRAQSAAADAEVDVVNANARGGLRAARANVTTAVDAARSASAQIAAAQAGLARARAQASQTGTTLARIRALVAERAVAQAELDNAQAADDAARAAVMQAEAQLQNASASRAAASSSIGQAEGRLEQSAPVEVLLTQAHARADLAHARVRSAEAALALARLQLSYTTVSATTDGIVSRLGIREGQLVQPGQSAAMLVPNATYVVANFKETQIGRMHAGNNAEIHVDAFPGHTFHGVVESLSGGTGARFSLLPPDNASGNFVKVVQRVPVRIRWTDAPRELALRAGLSADVTVMPDHRSLRPAGRAPFTPCSAARPSSARP
jgi:membrane fusion protein (multidrug efflux system)